MKSASPIPFVAASKGFIDEVIMPHSTRRRVAMGLRKLRNKQLENPWKKHDNIPLVSWHRRLGISLPIA